MHGLVHMGAGFTRGHRGWGQRKEQVTASRLLWSRQAQVPLLRVGGAGGDAGCSLLDPADTLHLGGLGMRAPLSEMLVVA